MKNERDISVQRKAASIIMSAAFLPRLFIKRKLPNEPKNILVMEWAYLGDMVLATPALKSLRSIYPASYIHLVTNPETEGYIKDFPFVDEISYIRNPFHLGRRRFDLADVLGCAVNLRRKRYDLVLEFTGRLTSQAFLPFLKAGYLIGQDSTGNAYFLDRRIHSGRIYEVDRDIDVVKACCCDGCDELSRGMWNPATDSDRRYVNDLIGPLSQRDYVVLHPVGSWRPRRWPAERWAKVVDHIISRGKGVIFIGVSNDITGIEEIGRIMVSRHGLNLAGMLTIRQVIALMEKARLFLGVDSGPMHLASTAHLKGVILFGPGDPLKWADPLHTVIYKKPDCGPCAQFAFTKRCRRGYDMCEGLSEITAEEVIDICERYL